MNRVIWLLACTTVLVGVGARGDEQKPNKTTNTAQEKLSGGWRDAGHYDADGNREKPNPEAALAAHLVFLGDRFVWHLDAGTYSVGKNGELDLVFTVGENKGGKALCRYALDGNQLTIAYPIRFQRDAARPASASFDPKAKNVGVSLFSRDEAIQKEKAEERMKSLIEYADCFSPDKKANSTQDQLKQVIERLDRIEKRLEAIEKAQAPKDKKK